MPNAPPGKFLNLEALKCHFWCSNATISVKNLSKICLQSFRYKSTWFYLIFFAVSLAFRDIRIFFCENLTQLTRVEVRIFLIPIACWSGFGIFKQNRDNPDEIGMVGQSDWYLLRRRANNTRNVSYIHQIPQAKNIPYQPLLIKPVFSLLENAEKKTVFSKLIFQLKSMGRIWKNVICCCTYCTNKFIIAPWPFFFRKL